MHFPSEVNKTGNTFEFVQKGDKYLLYGSIDNQIIFQITHTDEIYTITEGFYTIQGEKYMTLEDAKQAIVRCILLSVNPYDSHDGHFSNLVSSFTKQGLLNGDSIVSIVKSRKRSKANWRTG